MREKCLYCGSMHVDIEEYFKRINCSVYVELHFENKNCHCTTPCEEEVYKLQVSQSPWPHFSFHLPLYTSHIRDSPFSNNFNLISNNFLRIHIEKETGQVVHFKDTPALNRETFVGSLGGTLNLWIGVTFITLIEIVQLLYNLLTGISIPQTIEPRTISKPLSFERIAIKMLTEVIWTICL